GARVSPCVLPPRATNANRTDGRGDVLLLSRCVPWLGGGSSGATIGDGATEAVAGAATAALHSLGQAASRCRAACAAWVQAAESGWVPKGVQAVPSCTVNTAPPPAMRLPPT